MNNPLQALMVAGASLSRPHQGDPLRNMMIREGVDPAGLNPRSTLGSLFRKSGVDNSDDVRRILTIPKYRWQDDVGLEGLRWQLTNWLRRPGGSQSLRPVQAAALAAIHDYGGLLGPLRVGAGKTLITFLAPTVVGAKRALLLVPAKLKDKTVREFQTLRKHWRYPSCLKIMSYELLSRDRGLQELFDYRPDLILADEGHKLKNPKATCTKRIRKYLKAHEARYADMSGTMTKRSIMEYHHRQKWALQEHFRPLPNDFNRCKQWSDCLDEKIKPESRLAPGALLRFCTDGELKELADDPRPSTELRIVRQGYNRRLLSTPGVVGTEESFAGSMAIFLSSLQCPVSLEVRAAFSNLRENWETPGGEQITDAVSLWRHARELIVGFYYRWDPVPPVEWVAARRAWGAFVRETLKHYHHKYDSMMQIARACQQGELPAEQYLDWMAVREAFKPNTVPVWIDDTVISAAADWMRTPGICWVEHKAFGKRLAAVTGAGYYGAGGKNAQGEMIEDARGESIIASIAANSEGRNLQEYYSRNLVVSIPPGNNVWEQLIGRTHRDGQEADEVIIDTFIGCYEQWAAMRQSLADAEYAQRTLGQVQKLCIADVMVQTPEEVSAMANSGDVLWDKANAEFFSW